jgi:uncharacterized NAD(P)/FAD-binding protein YdhS
MREFTVAVAGGGASGTLAALALVRGGSRIRVAIVDPSERLGRGVAYSTACPLHVLNVPAGKMSAFPDDPDHFVRWLAARSGETYGPASFVPRALYGDYLGELAEAARASAPARLRHVAALAIDVRTRADGVRIACSNGETIEADALVVASGNAAPAAWPNVTAAARASGHFFDSAWDAGATLPASAGETVLVLGTGLTAVDAVLGLRHNGHRGPIHMVSRRGLLPHEHRVFDTPPATFPEADTVADLIDAVRSGVRDAGSQEGNWRGVIDGVRPRTNALWKALSLEEQRRFVRHALPYWNVHRHRIPPESAKAIAELMASGTLQMVAGRTTEIVAAPNGLAVTVKVRGSKETLRLEAGRAINCSGPQHDFRKLSNPLIASLLARGSMVPYPLDIGVRVAENGALVDAAGVPSQRLFAIGPARFGTLIETTAIPEIRVQARELGDLLTGRERVARLASAG